MNYNRYGTPVRQVTVGASDAYPFATYPTIQEAIDGAQPGDHVSIYPGEYAEALVIPDTLRDVVFVGAGALDQITVVPAANSIPLSLSGAKGVEFHNIGFEASGTADYAVYLHEGARRIGFYDCKMEGGDVAVIQIGHTAADTSAPADVVFVRCDITWGVSGVLFGTSTNGNPTQIYFTDCKIHNQTTIWVGLSAGGGFADVFFRNNNFLLGEDHTAPTAGISVSTSYGLLTGGSIQLASNAAGLGTHTNMKFCAVAFTDSFTTV